MDGYDSNSIVQQGWDHDEVVFGYIGVFYVNSTRVYGHCYYMWRKEAVDVSGAEQLKVAMDVNCDTSLGLNWRGSLSNKDPRGADCRSNCVWACPGPHKSCPNYGINSTTALLNTSDGQII